ncbi:hypothetical protein ACLOJK_001937 [Asimina triloba]
MQASSVGIWTDFNVRGERLWFGRGRGGSAAAKVVRIGACSSSSASSGKDGNGNGRENPRLSSSSAGSFLSRSQTYALLKQQMAVAAKFEDYKEAARIRDSLKSFVEEEPVLRLRSLMKKAINEERFEVLDCLLFYQVAGVQDAARYRDELKAVAPHSLLRCSSDATTLGIRVQVRSVFIDGRSQPSKGQYFFAYRIRITNNSDRPVQLLRRHWIITDANGKTENVWGIGVIGEQPVILPRTGFEYSSACPLGTAGGRMEGDFEMKHIDKIGSSTFNVAIAPFSLSILGDDDTDLQTILK